ncbi:type II toxin-antitoxin system Phd/YefM family antitoxin [Neptunomonas phycophila]|uniref:type II toxin-antitoxin system Phd/YefM family antitoxin n=1 Tax=Neptunomonas phycophila TaxID=1572645 RepID=UPI003514C431
MNPLLADTSTSISELKKNPMAVIEGGDGFPVAVLNRNKPVFYCVPAEAYEAIIEKLEDMELAAIIAERENDKEVEVRLSDL